MTPAQLIALTARIEGAACQETPLSHQKVRNNFYEIEQEANGYCSALQKETRTRVHNLLKNEEKANEMILRYEKRGYNLLLPEDGTWPKEMSVLKDREPLYMFAFGNDTLLRAKRKVSVAGSRDLQREAVYLAETWGKMIADHHAVLVSGGARGTDQIAQQSALQAKGNVIVFPAQRVQESMELQIYKTAFAENRLLFVTETFPDQPFSAHKALARNRLIYAMGNPATVVAAKPGTGGSWKGALDCLKKHWSTVLAFNGRGTEFDGCRALRPYGAELLDTTNIEQLWEQMERLNAVKFPEQLSYL